MLPGRPIVQDLLCVHCGYNLRGLASGALCPECGRLIHDSIRARTGGGMRRFLATLTKAYAFIAGGFTFAAIGIGVELAGAGGRGWMLLILGLPLVALAAACLTIRPPFEPRPREGWSARRMLNLLFWLTILPLMIVACLIPWIAFGDADNSAANVATTLTGLSAILAPLLWCAAIARTIGLARRHADDRLARFGRTLFGVHALAAGIAAVIAAAMAYGLPPLRFHAWLPPLAGVAFVALSIGDACLAARMAWAFHAAGRTDFNGACLA